MTLLRDLLNSGALTLALQTLSPYEHQPLSMTSSWFPKYSPI